MPSLLVNGRPTDISGAAPGTTLLDFLRAHGYTGAKEGCGEGECGACAVVVVASAADASRSQYQAINSCLVPLTQASGWEVFTVEGLGTTAALAGVQAALAEGGASQCGYCTPGFVMSLFAEQYRPGRTTPCDPLSMSGNLCRCTGYHAIGQAAHGLGPAPPGALLDRLGAAPPPLDAVDTPHFVRPLSLKGCVDALTTTPGARLVAGATDVTVDATVRGRRAPMLVSVEGIPELRAFSLDRHSLIVGAALPIAELRARWTDAPPAVHEWIHRFASPLVRNRATLGGNLATASPIGDAAPLLMALDAHIEIVGASGRRRVAVDQLFTGYRTTQLARTDVMHHISIPQPLPRVLGFYKVAKRALDDISTVAAAFALDLDEAGRVTRARCCFGGVAAVPLRAHSAEAAIVGHRWTLDTVGRVQARLGDVLSPISDHRGSKEYRRGVACALVEKFWWDHR